MNKVKLIKESQLWIRENRVLCPFCMSGIYNSIKWKVSDKESGGRSVSGSFQCSKCGARLSLPTNKLSQDIHLVTTVEYEDGTEETVRI